VGAATGQGCRTAERHSRGDVPAIVSEEHNKPSSVAIVRSRAVSKHRTSSHMLGSNLLRCLGVRKHTQIKRSHNGSLKSRYKHRSGRNICLGYHIVSFSNCLVLLIKHLIPVFQDTIQVARDHLARLPWVPLHCQNRCITCLDLVIHLARLPVPEHAVSAAVT
jgi:hypothetical protein